MKEVLEPFVPEEILRELEDKFKDRMFLTVREVRHLLHLGRMTVYDLIRKGELEAIKAPGKSKNSPYRILKSSVVKYLIEHYELNLN